MWDWMRRWLGPRTTAPTAKSAHEGTVRPTGRLVAVKLSRPDTVQLQESVAAIVRTERVPTAIRTADSGGVGSGADLHPDGGVDVMRTGRLSQGETPVARVGQVLLEAFRRDRMPYERIEDVSRRDARAEDGVDLRLHASNGAVLGVQVTRAVGDPDIGRGAATRGHANKRYSADELVDMLRGAIAKKSRGADPSRARIALALDATEVMVSLSGAAVLRLTTAHGDWIRSLGWHSVWLVGPAVSFTQRLDVHPDA